MNELDEGKDVYQAMKTIYALRPIYIHVKKKFTHMMKMVTCVLLLVAIALALLSSIYQAGVESFDDRPAPAGAD